jgi:hypothetical protein
VHRHPVSSLESVRLFLSGLKTDGVDGKILWGKDLARRYSVFKELFLTAFAGAILNEFEMRRKVRCHIGAVEKLCGGVSVPLKCADRRDWPIPAHLEILVDQTYDQLRLSPDYVPFGRSPTSRKEREKWNSRLASPPDSRRGGGAAFGDTIISASGQCRSVVLVAWPQDGEEIDRHSSKRRIGHYPCRLARERNT